MAVQRQQQRRRKHRNLRPLCLSPTLLVVTVVVILSTALWAITTSVVEMAVVVDAAHSSRRRSGSSRSNNEKYDREITTFSPDGRLPQVEYGMEASTRGSTVAALQLSVVAGDKEEGGDNNNNVVPVIVVCLESTSEGKMHRIDDHLWMATAGLAGDARYLANEMRNWCQGYRQNYGEAPTVGQAARTVADLQHFLTRRGGRRPLGCSAMVLGVTTTGGSSSGASASMKPLLSISSPTFVGKTRLYQADPGGGGGVENSSVCLAGRGRTEMLKEMNALLEEFQQKEKSSHGSSDVGSSKKSSTNVAVTGAAMKVADRFLKQLDRQNANPKMDKATSIDVWTIQPQANRRGGMLATCYRDVSRDDTKAVLNQYQ